MFIETKLSTDPPNDAPGIDSELSRLPDASADLLADRSLQERVDTKFLLDIGAAMQVLERVSDDYAVARAGDERVATYRTLYFDTPDLHFLHAHHRGRRPRFKVRIRHYVDREVTYLEVKRKTPADKTVKRRRPISFLAEEMTDDDRSFVAAHNPVDPSRLRPTVRTDFARITLVGLRSMERVTLDLDIRFGRPGANADAGKAVIAELKQATFSPRSPFFLALRATRARAVSISKYCTAVSMLYPDTNMNRFRPKLRSLRKAAND